MFSKKPHQRDRDMFAQAVRLMDMGQHARVSESMEPALSEPPFGLAAGHVIVEAVDRIVAIEKARGKIPRAERSALAPEAQAYQDLIDRLFYAMAGLTEDEIKGLEERLARML